MLTPQQFVEKWRGTPLSERSSYQLHFIDLCQMIGHETPGASGIDSKGKILAFEYGVKKDAGGQGFADVFYDGHFAIEYKAAHKHKDLKAAYDQLLQYREKLNNPPLLVVCDIENWEIHTNWPNTEKKIYRFTSADIAQRPSVLRWLQDLFEAPDRLHPRRNTEQITTEAARVFQMIANNMRDWQADPDRIAHFLTKLVFCLFAEDVGLLPAGPKGEVGIFSEIIENTRTEPTRFVRYAEELFRAMADGGEVMFQQIPYFNGALFEDVHVEELVFEALTELEKASALNWASVEPAIFGTLFERSLDPSKRAQLGAHYTSRADILLIVQPVLMQPLQREWDAIKAEAAPIRQQYDEALKSSNRRSIQTYESQLQALRQQMLHRLREIRVLDPACGSGNFLYVSLGLLMDMEKAVINDDLFIGLQAPFPEVHPRQMYGIEINPIAHALASIVVWIGYLQWRRNNGYLTYKEPILEQLADNIRQMDAILAYDANGNPIEPEWPEVDVIVGNPPFLGGWKHRSELGNDYVDWLWQLYDNRVPRPADLVCYWFEKARGHVEQGKAKRAGLLATNSIRGGANREVVERIKATGDIFMAWSDREWILDGAAVRVSMVGFDDKSEKTHMLDGSIVMAINPDLTGGIDLAAAQQLSENKDICLRGDEKHGPFDISQDMAFKMLNEINKSGLSNSDVVRPYINARDVVQHSSNTWIIDFFEMSLEEAERYEVPMAHVRQYVKPIRDTNNRERRREKWWQHGEIIPLMRRAIAPYKRFIVTPRVAKHRLFVWLNGGVIPDNALYIIARDDDYFFGVLHSRLHEVWSLRMGTWLGVGNDPRYTPTTTFETFPFPWPPGHEDTSSPAYQAVAEAAKRLHEERDAWLNPSPSPSPSQNADGEGRRMVSERELRERTLTNLYNALNVWRGVEKIRVVADAADFAPRLDDLHRALDVAVCDAYGWPHEILADDEEILRRLLALNLERAGNAV